MNQLAVYSDKYCSLQFKPATSTPVGVRIEKLGLVKREGKARSMLWHLIKIQ